MRIKNKYTSLITIWLVIWIFILAYAGQVWANPYFHLVIDPPVAVVGVNRTARLYLNTNGHTLTAAQTVLNYDNSMLTGVNFQTLSSRCSFWAPADPSLGFGSQSTPYFHNNNKAVFSCGFSNPGYTSSSSTGAYIASIILRPVASGSATLSFSDSQYRYIGSTIPPGTSPDLILHSFDSTDSADLFIPTPTPTLTPIPAPTVEPIPEHSLDPEDIEFVEITASTTANGQTTQVADDETGTLLIVEQDDSIPPPPADLPERERPTPFVLAPATDSDPDRPERDEGEVLSVASLRELLIPGQSPADRTVVMVNLISTLTFLVLLSIAIWRMITISRLNKVKYQHMQEMLAGELSVIQSKIGSTDNKSGDMNEEIKKSFESLVDSFESGDKS